MTEELILNLITQLGFPIGITIYLVISGNKTLKENTEAIQELKNVIIIHYGKKE